MTEIKRQSTVQPEQIQGFNSPAEDELNLKDLLRFLARKIKFILAITSFCTLFSIFYAQSITPIYRATVGLLDHNERFSSFSILKQLDPKLTNKVDNQTIKPLTIFERFLLNIKSHKFKQEVFVNGGFQKKFSRETGIDTDQSVSEIYSSTKIVKLDGTTYLELKGSKPKVMLEFLTALVEASKENVNKEIDDIQRSTVKTRINNFSTQIEELQRKITLQKQIEKKKMALEIEELHQKIAIEIEELQRKIAEEEQREKEKKALEKAKEIASLSEALDMAKRMGIKNNNFDKKNSDSFPLWFLYGELALQQEITSLRSKEEEISNTDSLSTKRIKLKRLQQEITSLRSKKEEIPNTDSLSTKRIKLKRLQQEITSLRSKEKKISNTDSLSTKRIKLQRSQIADLPLLKFKVATLSEHTYYLVKPYQPWAIVGFGLAFGLFISICMAYLIDLKQLGAKEIPTTST